MVSLAVAVYETLCTFSCLICRKRYRRLALALSILPAWPCRLPCTKAGIDRRDTSPDAESEGSRQHMAQLAHQLRHPWRSTLYLHNSAHVFFFRSSRFQGLPCCGFFLPLFFNPTEDYRKSERGGKTMQHIIHRTRWSEQPLGQSPCPAPHSRSEQGFRMISLLFLNQTRSSSCVAGFQLLKSDPREDMADTQESCKALKCERTLCF